MLKFLALLMAVLIVAQPVFASRSFDGSNDCLQTAAAVDISGAGANEFSLSFWMLWDSFGNDDQLAFESTANYNSGDGAFIVDPNDSGGVFVFGGHDTSGGYETVSFTRPSGGVWHHYLLVMDGDVSGHKAYVDGSSQGLSTVSDQSGVSWESNTIYFMSRNCASLHADGDMAEVGIWDVDVSAHVAALAAGWPPIRVRPADLVWYSPLHGLALPEPDYIGSSSVDSDVPSADPSVADHAPVVAPWGFRSGWGGDFTSGGAPASNNPESLLLGVFR